MKRWCCGLLLLYAMLCHGQKRWTGYAGNGQWEDPFNWENGILPGVDEEVVLDNSISLFSYAVRLPDWPVSIATLRLAPAAGNNITLELPASNLVTSPASSTLDRGFTTTGEGYSLDIHKGGVFINASGGGSGYSVRFNDSVRVLGGGTYVHRTRTGHAEIVQQLSRTSGTGTGVFRMENTDGSSIVSLSGRVYGTFQLSAAGSPSGAVAYSVTGTSPALVRGDFIIEDGVLLTMNFGDTVTIEGDLRIGNGTLNLANGNRSACLRLMGHWEQAGTLLESGTAVMPGTVLLAGEKEQRIHCTGSIRDSIAVILRNTSHVLMEAPLRLPYRLRLEKGIIRAVGDASLVLSPQAMVELDTSSNESYVETLVTRESVNPGYYLFPVGSDGFLRWLAVKGASGDVSVGHIRESAYAVNDVVGSGLDHLSRKEYWRLDASVAQPSSVTLSFDNGASGGVSDLPTLRVARSEGAQWQDAGNAGTTGAAEDAGSITSGQLSGMIQGRQYFTLASSSSLTNVLPVSMGRQWLAKENFQWCCNWQVIALEEAVSFQLELSINGIDFIPFSTIPAVNWRKDYRCLIPAEWQVGYCRVNVLLRDGNCRYGKPMHFDTRSSVPGIEVRTVPGSRSVRVFCNQSQEVIIELVDGTGRCIERKNHWLRFPVSEFSFAGRLLAKGIYYIRLLTRDAKIYVAPLLFQ